MKLLYGINTNGQGHINRSRIFISELIADGHEVHVFLSGKQPPKYAYELADRVFFKTGPFDIYQDNKVLARISKKYFRIRDTYDMFIEEYVSDEMAMLLLCTVIVLQHELEERREDQRKKKRRRGFRR